MYELILFTNLVRTVRNNIVFHLSQRYEGGLTHLLTGEVYYFYFMLLNCVQFCSLCCPCSVLHLVLV